MVKINRSRAGHIEDDPVLECPLDTSYMDRWQTSVFQNIFFGQGLVDKRVRYLNQSTHEISIIDGTGIVLDLPGTNRIENRLVICINFTWGGDVELNIGAIIKHWPNLTQEYLEQLVGSVKNKGTNTPCELDFYFIVDLDHIDTDPYGLWIEALNVQVVSTDRAKKTTFFPRDCFFSKNDELYRQEDIIWTTTTTVAYFVDDERITESVFMPFGSDLLEVKPVFMPDMPVGIHINLRGNVTFAARRDNAKAIVIKPGDFKKYGIYSSLREWREAVKESTKGMSKEDAQRRMDCFDMFHRHLYDEELEPLAVRDIILFRDISVGTVVDFLAEVAKADALLEKIFRKR